MVPASDSPQTLGDRDGHSTPSGVLPAGWEHCQGTRTPLPPLPARGGEPSFLFASPRRVVHTRAPSSPHLLRLTWLCLMLGLWKLRSPGKVHVGFSRPHSLPGGQSTAPGLPDRAAGKGNHPEGEGNLCTSNSSAEKGAQAHSHPLPAHSAETSVQLHRVPPPGRPIPEPSIPPQSHGFHPRPPTLPGPGSQQSPCVVELPVPDMSHRR